MSSEATVRDYNNLPAEEHPREVTNYFGRRCLVKRVKYGYEVCFLSQEDADEAVQGFWEWVDPKTKNNFSNGQWKTTDQISFGPRTEPGALTAEEESLGFKVKMFFGGNTQPIGKVAERVLHNQNYIE